MTNRTTDFWSCWQEVTIMYENYTRAYGLNLTQFYILNLIASRDDCTQKLLCDHLSLSKQRVNSIVSSFCERGYTELQPSPVDRRSKIVHLTPSGRDLMDQLLPVTQSDEISASAGVSKKDQNMLVKIMRKYIRTLKRIMY